MDTSPNVCNMPSSHTERQPNITMEIETNSSVMTTASAIVRTVRQGVSVFIKTRLTRVKFRLLGLLLGVLVVVVQQILSGQRSRPTNNPLYQERALHGNNEEIRLPKKEDMIRLKKIKRIIDHQMIDILCDMYRREVITGSLCDQMCNLKTITATGRPDKGQGTGKRVYVLNCTNCLPDPGVTSVVMKLFWEPKWENDTNTELTKYKTLESYEEYLTTILNTYTTMYYDNVVTSAVKTLAVVWGEPIDRDASVNDRVAVLRSIAGLIEQHTNVEYLSLRLFQKERFIPRVYGTCGPAYFVELAPTFQYLGFAFGRYRTQAARYEIYLKVLQLIKDMDNVNGQGLIQCDIKPSHLGLTKDDRVVLTDVDDLRHAGAFWSFIKPKRQVERHCSNMVNCNQLRCYRACNHQTNTCELAWLNNNLQRICSNVFSRTRDFSNTAQRNLPSGTPTLREILLECKKLSFSDQDRLRRKSDQVYEQFNETLTTLLVS